MKKETIKSLKGKGWSEDEIVKAEKIIAARRLVDKSRSSGYSSKLLYWMAICVMIIGNFLVSFLLVPFLLVFNKGAMDVIVVVLGFAFGALFNLLILDIEHLNKKHHLIAGILIPVLALINISVVVNVANAINDVFRITNIRENPITISALYVIAFMIPYLWTVFVSKKLDFSYNGISEK